ncbi:MAG: protoporphyrinogen oxidase, partial [Planctomycetales bacterium]|nr:protoporphyrinogen oxidase [Planctomycetales bacterium]
LTRLLSWGGKFRLVAERWIPAPKEIQCADYDESVASFATRRLGREAFERLVQPLLAGIYTADPEQLSLAATMPDAIVAEREYGSLTRAILHKARQASSEGGGSDSRASGARYASFVTPREGLGQLIEALAQRLPPAGIHLGKPISRVSRTSDQKWMVYLENNEPCGPYDGVVVAVPAPLAAVLVDEVDPQLGELLSNISYASSAVVCLVYRRDQIARQLDGFGLVMPSVEQKNIVAASFSSVKYPGRAPDDQVLVRVFLGGALQPEKVDLTDEKLQQLAEDELGELIGIRGAPLRVDVVRWREKMPQYHVGHVQLVEAIEQRVAQLDGLELAGNAYRGVGIPQCIHSGDNAARRLLAHFPPGPE